MPDSKKDTIIKEWPRWGGFAEQPETFTMRDGQLRHKCGVNGRVVLLMDVGHGLYACSCTGCGAEGVLTLGDLPPAV